MTYVLCTMSHLATWQGKPRVGIDHALAAGAWAAQTGNPHAQAYAADVAARAYAADHQPDRCQAALEREQSAVAGFNDTGHPTSSWWYFHDKSFCWETKSECALKSGQPVEAWDAAEQSLVLIDSTNLHNYALTLSFQGEARIQQGDAVEACRILGDVARLTPGNTSSRIIQRLHTLRLALTPWDNLKAVHELDEQLAFYRRPSPSSGKTNRSYAE